MPRSNKERTEATRIALLDAARQLFVEKGYVETVTPDIAAVANVTRGALYHHFPDKKALFVAVARRESDAVAAEIEKRAAQIAKPRDAIIAGASAYFDSMAVPGRTRLLLLEAPALFTEDQAELALKSGLSNFLTGSKTAILIDPLTVLLSAAFDRAALEIDKGADRSRLEAGIAVLIDGLAS